MNQLHDHDSDDALDHPHECTCPACERWAMRELILDAECEHAVAMGEIERWNPMPDVRALFGTWPGEPDDGFEAAVEEHRHG